jgi:hypothetical protein
MQIGPGRIRKVMEFDGKKSAKFTFETDSRVDMRVKTSHNSLTVNGTRKKGNSLLSTIPRVADSAGTKL